jgi:hypothetical protein
MIGRVAESDSRLFMKRLPVNSADDTLLFEAKLAGAYDWLHAPQWLTKILKTNLRNG